MGTGKATGKTEVLRALVSAACRERHLLGITSLGTEGEEPQKTSTKNLKKICVCRGTLFATLEGYFRAKRFVAELLYLSSFWTAVGRIAVGRALADGELILSGPVTSSQLREITRAFLEEGAETVLTDGFASRAVHASPCVSEGVVLATGSALSSDLAELVERTVHFVRMINLPEVSDSTKKHLQKLDPGVWSIGDKGTARKLYSRTVLNLPADCLEEECKIVYSTGAVGERFVNSILKKRYEVSLSIVVRDFTRLFISPQTLNSFLGRGGRIEVMERASLVAIAVNPVSESRKVLESREIIEILSSRVGVPVIDTHMEI